MKKTYLIYGGIFAFVFAIFLYLYIYQKDKFLSFFESTEDGEGEETAGGGVEVTDTSTPTEQQKDADGAATGAANAVLTADPSFRNDSNEHYCEAEDRMDTLPGNEDDVRDECAAHTHKYSDPEKKNDCTNHRGGGYCYWYRDRDLAEERGK